MDRDDGFVYGMACLVAAGSNVALGVHKAAGGEWGWVVFNALFVIFWTMFAVRAFRA